MREFEVLKKVNHESIVKLLAIEEEVRHFFPKYIMLFLPGGPYTALQVSDRLYILKDVFLLQYRKMHASIRQNIMKLKQA